MFFAKVADLFVVFVLTGFFALSDDQSKDQERAGDGFEVALA